MTRRASAALVALCALGLAPLAALAAAEAAAEAEEPPRNFPDSKALPFNADKVPTPKTPLEAIDVSSTSAGDAERVNHTKVLDPGTTHVEGGGRGAILACTLPSGLHAPGANGSASDWLADSGNVSEMCHLPAQWLHGASASGTLRVCSIPHDAWNNSYTITDGTIPKELLAELNTSSVKCVTPSEALSGGGKGSIANGSIPSAWLRDSNDTIYIYIIPQEWLRVKQPPASATGNASEVEDLTKDTLNAAPPMPAPAPDNSSAASSADPAEVPASFNSSNATSATVDAAPAAKTNSSDTAATTSDPVVVPATSMNATDNPKDEMTKGAEKTEPPSTTIATQKSEEKFTAGVEDKVTEKNTVNAKTEEYSDAQNEVAHRPSSEALSQQHRDHNHAASSGKTAFLQPTESAAILAGVFVAIALLGYIGLLLWRRVLEKKYGNREMLVNGEDDFDSSDTRHFEL